MLRTSIFSICVVASMLSTAALAAPMTADEIRSSMIGHTVKWKSKDGSFSGTTTYGNDGSVAITGNFKKAQKDTGRWQIKANTLCTTYKILRDGAEACGIWSKISATSFVDEDGTVATIGK